MRELIITLIIILSIIVFVFLLTSIIILSIFRRKKEISLKDVDLTKTHYGPYKDIVNNNISYMENVKFEEVLIKTKDKHTLYGYYYNNNSNKTVIFVHGLHSTVFNNFATQNIEFIKRGYNILNIVQRSHGKSSGFFITMGIKESNDVMDWITYVKNNIGGDIYLYGTSMGSTTIAYLSDKVDKSVKCLICDCGFTSTYDIVKLDVEKSRHNAKILTPIVGFMLKFWFGINYKDNTKDSLKDSVVPVIFIHGKMDNDVPYSMSEENYSVCSSKKLLLINEVAGHTSSFLISKDIQEKVFGFLSELEE